VLKLDLPTLYKEFNAVFGGFAINHDVNEDKKYQMNFRSGVCNTAFGYFEDEGRAGLVKAGLVKDNWHETCDYWRDEKRYKKSKVEGKGKGNPSLVATREMSIGEKKIIKGLFLLYMINGPLSHIHLCYTVETILKAYKISERHGLGIKVVLFKKPEMEKEIQELAPVHFGIL
jgi:hypothetical protein